VLLEALESRDLLSVVPIFMARESRNAANSAASVQAILNRAATSVETGNSSTDAQPTARELLRQRYSAKAVGTYTTGPGRFTDQVLQGAVLASGSSNQSLHVDVQLQFFEFTDPTKPVSGVAAVIPRNTSTTGSNLILDLTASPPSSPGKLPTHFTWTVDSSSGGLYTTAGPAGGGQGTLDIHYVPTGVGHGRVTTTGRASVVIQGLVNANGTFSNISGPGNR